MSRRSDVLLLAAVLLISALLVWLSDTNQALFLALNNAGSQLPAALWSNLTLVADTLFAIAILLIAGCYRPIMFNQSLVLLILGSVFVHVFKQWLDVPRPPAVLDQDTFRIIGHTLTRHSFPSGHAFTAMSCAGLIWLNSHNKLWAVSALIIGGLAALSRTMVGAHWPLDILVGSASGLLFALLSVWLVNHVRWLRSHGLKLFTALVLTLASASLATHKDGYPDTDLLAWAISALALTLVLIKVWIPLTRLVYQAYRE